MSCCFGSLEEHQTELLGLQAPIRVSEESLGPYTLQVSGHSPPNQRETADYHYGLQLRVVQRSNFSHQAGQRGEDGGALSGEQVLVQVRLFSVVGVKWVQKIGKGSFVNM